MAEYIEREALLLRIDCYGTNKFGMLDEDIRAFVKAQPAADVAPVVHGRWEQDADGDWYCTNCNEVVAICESGRERTYRKPYCPNCGAKMDLEVKDG